jgi:DNA-binding IclR family transcriptional regulator
VRSTQVVGNPVSVVERLSLILEAFNGVGPLTLSQVTARTGLPRSSAHRLLEQLTSVGWLARSPEQTYELGVKAYELGQAALKQNRLLQSARPVMSDFAQRTGFTIQLAVLDRGDTVYLAKFNGRSSGPTPTSVGQRLPGHLTAVGKAIMAYDEVSPSHFSSRGLSPNFGSATSLAGPGGEIPARWTVEFSQIRDTGAAFDRGEAFPGVGCIGVSIGPVDHTYGNLAAISVCGPVTSLDYRKLVSPARVAARAIWDRCVAVDLASG